MIARSELTPKLVQHVSPAAYKALHEATKIREENPLADHNFTNQDKWELEGSLRIVEKVLDYLVMHDLLELEE